MMTKQHFESIAAILKSAHPGLTGLDKRAYEAAQAIGKLTYG